MRSKHYARWVAALLCVFVTLGLRAQFNNQFSYGVSTNFERGVTGVPNPTTGSIDFCWDQDVSGSADYDMRRSRLDPLTGQIVGFPQARGYSTPAGIDEVLDIAVTPTGDYILVGYTTDNSTGFGGEDAVVFYTNPSGAVQWALRFGDAFNDRAHSVIYTMTGEVVVTGFITSLSDARDVWLTRISTTGVVAFSNTYPGLLYDDYGTEVLEGVAGGSPVYFVGGTTQSHGPTPGPGYEFKDFFIMRTDYIGGAAGMNVIGMIGLGEIDEELYNFERTIDGGFLIGGVGDIMPLGSAGPMRAVACKVDPGGFVSMYKLFDRSPVKPEDCWVHERAINDYIALGNYTNDPFGTVHRWTFLFNAATAPGPIVSNSFSNADNDPMFGMLPPNSLYPGYMMFGNTWSGMGNFSDVWTVATDANGMALAPCQDTVHMNIFDVGATIDPVFPPIVPTAPPVPFVLTEWDLLFPDLVSCDTLLPIDSCWANTDTLYMKITTNITYNSGIHVWPHKVYVGQNVTVTVDGPGTILDITTGDVVFGKNAQIVYQNGATIRANNTVFRPCIMTDTWLGIDFTTGANGIVDECVFKNAEIALDVVGAATANGTQVKIANNEFVNCGKAVHTLQAGTSAGYMLGITGNTVLVDNDFPLALPLLPTFYGFHLENTNFRAYVSQNDFVYSRQSPVAATANLTGIFIHRSDVSVTENKFTNCITGIYLFGNPSTAGPFLRTIENNEIEFNDLSWTGPTVDGIFLDGATFVVVEGNNVLYTQAVNPGANTSGIRTFGCASVAIAANTVRGFQYGIFNRLTTSTIVTENHVDDSRGIGIDGWDCYTGYRVTENQVRNDNKTGIGIVYVLSAFGSTAGSRIESNCIHDTQIAINTFCGVGAPAALPVIRDNFLYNYASFGLLNTNMNGSIGVYHAGTCGVVAWSDNDFARNSFLSNNRPLLLNPFDVFSSTAITMGGNFAGADNNNGTAWQTPGSFWDINALVTLNPAITCNRGSRANCASQIVNKMQVSGSEELIAVITEDLPLNWDGATFTLRSDYETVLAGLTQEERTAAVFILQLLLNYAGYETDQDHLAAFAAAPGNLPENPLLWFNYLNLIDEGNYSAAASILATITGASQDETDKINLEIINLTKMMNTEKGSSLTTEEITLLVDMDARAGASQTEARALLNAAIGNYPVLGFSHPLYEPENPGEPLHIAVGSDAMEIHPNPGTGIFTMEWSLLAQQDVTISVVNIVGQEVMRLPQQYWVGRAEVDLSAAPEGIYFVSVKDAQGSGLVSKYVKQ